MIARHSIWEHLREVTPVIGAPPAKQKMLDQLCALTVYDRKQALQPGRTAQSEYAKLKQSPMLDPVCEKGRIN